MMKYTNIVIVFATVILTTFVLVQCVFAQSNHPMSLKDQTITRAATILTEEEIYDLIHGHPLKTKISTSSLTFYTEKDLWALGSKVDSIAILYKHNHSSSGRWSIHIDAACGIVGLDFVERGDDLAELINRTLTKYYDEVCCK